MGKKKGVLKCSYCELKIKNREKYVSLITTKHKKVLEELHYHFECWVRHFEDCALRKAKAVVQGMQSKAVGVLNSPMMQGVLKNTVGGDLLGSMLNTDLSDKDIVVYHGKKKEDGKKDKKPKTKTKV